MRTHPLVLLLVGMIPLVGCQSQYHVDPKGIEPHIPEVHEEIERANQRLCSMRTSLAQ